MVIFWKLYVFAAEKNTLKGLENNTKHRYKVRNRLLLDEPPEVFYKKAVLKNFAIFPENHLCWSLFFNKVRELRSEALLKKRLQHRCLLVNIAKFLRTFLQSTSSCCFCKKRQVKFSYWVEDKLLYEKQQENIVVFFVKMHFW